MIKNKFLIILILFIIILLNTSLFIFSDNSNNKLQTFTTDWCTLFPDGTYSNKNLWIECCIKHDKVYWKWWTWEEKINSDNALEKCVWNKGHKIIWKIMKYWVFIWWLPYFPTSFRWWYWWEKFKNFN